MPADLGRRAYFRLRDVAYGKGKSPWNEVLKTGFYYHTDMTFRDSNLMDELTENVLKFVPDVMLWLEVGSYVGNSAIKAGKVINRLGLTSTSIMCMDPWTANVKMWGWNEKGNGERNWLETDEGGTPRIYETFLSNVHHAKLDHMVLPMRVTSMVGMRFLKQMNKEKRLKPEYMPKIIYLDSSHEKDETLMELTEAYSLLQKGGMLMGDDWNWPSVRGDVIAFANASRLRRLSDKMVTRFDLRGGWKAQQPVSGVVELRGQWLIPKPM